MSRDKVPKLKGYEPKVSYLYTAKGGFKQYITYVPKTKQRLLTYKKQTYTFSGGSLLKSIFIMILLVSIVGTLTNTTNANITFYGFLDLLQRAPKIPTDWISFGGDLQGVPFIGWLISAIRVLMFFVVGISQAIVFILYFLGFLFGVPV